MTKHPFLKSFLFSILCLTGPTLKAATLSQTWDAEKIEHEIIDRSHVEIGYNFANFIEGNITNNNGTLLKDLKAQGALRLGGHFTYLYLPNYFSLSVGAAYESPRRMNWDLNIGNGLKDFTNQQRLSFWEINTTAHLDLPWFWEAYLGANYTLPILSNSPGSMSGNLGFIAGANYWWTRNIGTGLVYRMNNFSYKALDQSFDMSLSGIELRLNLKFL